MNAQNLLISLTCLFIVNFLSAQPLVDDKQSYGVLIFEHLDKKKTQLIREGGWVKYKLYSNPKVTYKGTLQKITNNTMIVEGHEVKLSDCSMIAGRVRTEKEILGALSLGIGVAIIPFAAGIASTVTLAPALAIIGGGVVLMGTGIHLLMRKKRFKMDRGWSVYGGELSFSRTHN